MTMSLEPLTKAAFQELIKEPTVFYPGSGDDLHTLDIFGPSGASRMFIHADYLVSPNLGAVPEHTAFKVVAEHDLTFEQVCDLINGDKSHPFEGEWARFADWRSISRGLSKWVVFEVGAAHQRVGLLHLFDEATWVYWHIWAKHGLAPLAILIQDHGFGGNWASFGGGMAPLFAIAEKAMLPDFLVVGENTQAWPGYQRIRPAGTGGMHELTRHLYRRAGVASDIRRAPPRIRP